MQTITIVASRGGGFFTDTEMLVGSAIVIALVAWAVLSRVRHLRKPHG